MESQCSSGQCIPLSRECDFQKDCCDSSDEGVSTCTSSKLVCSRISLLSTDCVSGDLHKIKKIKISLVCYLIKLVETNEIMIMFCFLILGGYSMCDFESDLCPTIWTQVTLDDDFDWTRGQGATGSDRPSTDHTTLSSNGKMLLKTLDTIGNCQRPVFSLGVSQHMHNITNL